MSEHRWHFIGPEGAQARPAVRFVDALPQERQLELLGELAAVKPQKPRRARARSFESYGAAVLAARAEQPAKRAWVVRLYFTSMGDEQLCTEFGGLTEQESASIALGRDCDRWEVKRPRDVKCSGLAESDPMATHYPKYVGACAAETWCACRGHGRVERPIPVMRPGVRLVVFPSELK